MQECTAACLPPPLSISTGFELFTCKYGLPPPLSYTPANNVPAIMTLMIILLHSCAIDLFISSFFSWHKLVKTSNVVVSGKLETGD